MTVALGLDIGTTTLSAVAYDPERVKVVATLSRPNDAARHPAPGRAELDLGHLQGTILGILSRLVDGLPRHGEEVAAIGVTGQQHGVAFLGADLAPVSPAITWQDRRVIEPGPATGETTLARFLRLAGGPAAFEDMGCAPAAGYMGPTLLWLRERDELPDDGLACFIPDVAVAWLTGRAPVTDPTDAGSSALYDLRRNRWAWEAIDRLGLARRLFPAVQATGTLAGGLSREWATHLGLPQGTPVAVALGDNQASFCGSVPEPERSVLINIGTGGQISARIDAFSRLDGFDTRAYLPDTDGSTRYLLVGAGYPGGSAYAALEAFYRRVGTQLLDIDDPSTLFEPMNRLAAEVPPGCDGVRCEPLFDGTRERPDLRGAWTGLTTATLTPGHLARALLEGVAEGYADLCVRMRPVIGTRHILVGAGNGLARNPLLVEILSTNLDLPMALAAYDEAAAVGAAMVAASAIVA